MEMLQKEVRDMVLRLNRSKPYDVARQLIIHAVTSEGSNFKAAPPLIEEALKKLIASEQDNTIAETYRSVAEAVKRMERALQSQGTKEQSLSQHETEVSIPTEFAIKEIIPFEKKTRSAYLLEDLAKYLEKRGLILKDRRDLFFGMPCYAYTPYGSVDVNIHRAPLIGNYDFSVLTADSSAGHYVIRQFESHLMQKAIVFYKDIARPTEIHAIFGGRSREFYEKDILSDSTLRIVPYETMDRF